MNEIVVTIGVFLALGALIGAIHAGLLFRAVTMLAGTPRVPVVMALNAARFGLAIAAFWFVAQEGAVALIATVTGFTLVVIGARFVVERS